MRYSDKQAELLRMFKQGQLRRINILHGSVRSGKTWISLVLWAFWILSMPRDGSYLMVAKTLTSLKRNCLDLLETLVGREHFTYSLSAKQATLFGRTVYLEGVNDARAESKIRGMTLAGAYCDELTLFTEDFFSMLLSRLSDPGAKLFGTTNPDTPFHWIKVKYIDRQNELDMLVMQFLIDDNPYLDPEYVEQLKKEYTGVFNDRFIKGLWVVAEGLIYPMFDPKKHVVKAEDRPYKQYYISCDYGTANPTSMGLWGEYDGTWYRIREHYWDGRAGGQKTDEEHYLDLERLAGGLPIRRVIVDPSAASFIECIRRHGRFRVQPANNDVIDGIRDVGTCLSLEKIKFNDCCTNSFAEFSVYVWDDKAACDKPVKDHDHAMDDIRYFVHTIVMSQPGIRVLKPKEG